MSFLYLASPYSSPIPENAENPKQIMEMRYHEVKRTAYLLLREQNWVHSSILHCHVLADDYALPKDSRFWNSYNKAILRKADALLILTLPSWRESRGVTAERRMAVELGLPIWFIEPESSTILTSEPKE
jgi:hypothetical protein